MINRFLDQMEVHWALERVSVDRWCVFDTYNGVTLSDASTPVRAIEDALENPLTPEQRKYSPQWIVYAQKHIIGEKDE